jgi:molecular chaperone DnaK
LLHPAPGRGAPRVVGIDLGTTNTCAAWADGRIPRMVPFEGGHHLLASVVAFVGERRVIGQHAKDQLLLKPSDTVYGAKRLVGRAFHSPCVQELQRHFAYRVVEGADGRCAVDVGGRVRSLDEISALLLTQVRHYSGAHLGGPVEGAVISVPAYYPEPQREAVRAAAKAAGLDVWRLINEPTAACLAYGLGRDLSQKVMVFDLGGGTFDVSVLEIDGGTFHVLATGGDGFLGGVDFDIRLTDYLLDRFEKEEGVALRGDAVVVQRVLNAAESVKCDLSLLQHAEVRLPFVAQRRGNPVDMVLHVGRQTLNSLCEDLVDRTLRYVDEVLLEAKLEAADIDEVLLVGGQTRMPLLQARLERHFKKPPRRGLHPDEVVAQGAALLARSLASGRGLRLLDVLSVPIGLARPGPLGVGLEIVLRKNVVLPHVEEVVIPTERDDQTRVTVDLFQGKGPGINDAEYLGTVTVDNLPRGPKGAFAATLQLSLDVESLLTVRGHAGEGAKLAPLVVEKRPPRWLGEGVIEQTPLVPAGASDHQRGLLERWLKR